MPDAASDGGADAGARAREPSSPTLLVGLGQLGIEVLQRLDAAVLSGRRKAELKPSQIPIVLPPEGLDESQRRAEVERIVGFAERALSLDAAMQREAGDRRRPDLDLFVVVDMSEAAAMDVAPGLVAEASQRLLERFSNIFRGHGLPNLTVCPVVVLPNARKTRGAESQQVLRAFEAVVQQLNSGAHNAMPVARVFVVEQQTQRYELRRSEVISNLVAFLSLVVATDLRSQEPLRGFLRSSVGEVRDQRVFASFGCSTLELSLHRYCIERASAELVEGIRQARGASVAEQSVRAQRLVPKVDEVVAHLASGDGEEDLVELLRAHTPHIDFPLIGESDSPERIRDIVYGWGWFDALEAAVAAQVKRLDEREMDEVARVVDERGLAQVRRLQEEVEAAVREEELDGPQGWARALRLAEVIRDRAQGASDELQDDLRSEELPDFPSSQGVEKAFRALRDEATLRPRGKRMLFFGGLCTLMLSAFLQFFPKWFLVTVLAGTVSPLNFAVSARQVDVRAWRYLVDTPYVIGWLLLVVGAVVGFLLHRYRELRHQQLLNTRDDLQAAVRRYLVDAVGDSIRRYYESRLNFSQRDWALRMLQRVATAAEREIARLSKVSLALDRLAREFRQASEGRERSASSGEGDLVYRTETSPELLRKTYDAARPGADLLSKLFVDLAGRHKGSELPEYLFADRIRHWVAPHATPSLLHMAELAGPTVVEFVRRRHGKLGVPLEVRSNDSESAAHTYIFAPAWARPPLEALASEDDTLPVVHPLEDPDRIHLVSIQACLHRDAIVLPTGEPSKQ